MNLTDSSLELRPGRYPHGVQGVVIAADDLAASRVAFANTDGGQLIFDVNNQKRLIRYR